MYKITVDNGKPFDVVVKTEEELRKKLTQLKRMSETDKFGYFDVFVYDDKGNDITESQFVEEMIMEIIEKDIKKVV